MGGNQMEYDYFLESLEMFEAQFYVIYRFLIVVGCWKKLLK